MKQNHPCPQHSEDKDGFDAVFMTCYLKQRQAYHRNFARGTYTNMYSGSLRSVY